MRLNLLLSAAATALIASISVASAFPTESFTSNTVNLTSGSPTGTLTLSAFNTALGTLTSVEFTTTNTESLQSTIFPTSVPLTLGSPTPVSSTAMLTVTAPGSLGLGSTTLNTTGFSGVVSNLNTVNALPNSVTQTLTADIGTITSGLSAFETGTSYNLSLLLNATTTGSVPSGLGFEGQDGNAAVSTTVTYTYIAPSGGSPVPEPASMALMGSGLIGLAGLVRRRRR